MTNVARYDVAKLIRNRVRAIRIVAGICKQLLFCCHLRMYILTEIYGCSKVGRREDLHADEEGTESLTG